MVRRMCRSLRQPSAARLPPAARCICMTTASTIVRYPGSDCTEQFSGIQHPAKVWDVIQDYYIGDVVKEEHVVYTFKVVSKL